MAEKTVQGLVVLVVLAIIGGIGFGMFVVYRDATTLDPLPDGVTQQGASFTVAPSVQDEGATPGRLCARIGPGGDDSAYDADYLPSSVTTDADGRINVKCAYSSG
jgi:hypothetical protein